jgi:Fe(3+) dicitrate transport protein
MNYITSIKLSVVSLILPAFLFAQTKDSVQSTTLKNVVIIGYKSMQGIGHLNETSSRFIYTGKKTEIIEVDSIDANKAINNTRQILGRIPGVNIVESETGGFVANGIGIRGLNPVQSLELNVRQNGYNIAADVYGYNETYYLPPMEAVERVEVVKGASSLQFGSQLGGMVNYILKEGAANKPVGLSVMETVGSNGLFNHYISAGGTIGKLNYFSFVNYRNLNGWRDNSKQHQLTGFGRIKYQANEKLSVSLEYSLLGNKLQMPGGLTDDQFEENSKTSVRSRNWLKSPWNILSANVEYRKNANTTFHLTTTFLSGERSLVWFNKLPNITDAKDSVSGEYRRREVDREKMKSLATELGVSHRYKLGNLENTLAAGARLAFASFKRLEEAPGTNGNNFDLSTTGEYEEQFDFTTFNAAVFFENRIRISDNFSVSPGIRLESLESEGEAEFEEDDVEKEMEQEKQRLFILPGIGLQYEADKWATVYGNITRSYRPIDYGHLFPIGSVSQVDPDLKDPKGWSADIGVRGVIKSFFNYDISFFYLRYMNRLGTVLKQDETGTPYTYRTNQDQSTHKGVESYLELNISRALKASKHIGELSVYHSIAYTDARYSRGAYKGNNVEYAPKWINRVGMSYAIKWYSASLQFSQQSKSYGDAANTERSSNPIIGRVPAYQVVDLSMTARFKQLKLKAGINNLANEQYFTQRTDEYPGPGIIPSIGRNFYVGVGVDVF